MPCVVPIECPRGRCGGVEFQLGNFHEIDRIKYDVLLILDVSEHVRDPFSFLENSRRHANNFVFHVPLDLGASAIIRVQVSHCELKAGKYFDR